MNTLYLVGGAIAAAVVLWLLKSKIMGKKAA